MLDVAVREPKGEDRRCRDADSLPGRGRRPVLRLFDTLDVRGQHSVPNETRHAPALALTLHRVPDRRKDLSSEVVLEVSVRIADEECLRGDVTPRWSLAAAMPAQVGHETACARFPLAATWYLRIPGTTPRPGLGGAAVDGGLARPDGPLPVPRRNAASCSPRVLRVTYRSTRARAVATVGTRAAVCRAPLRLRPRGSAGQRGAKAGRSKTDERGCFHGCESSTASARLCVDGDHAPGRATSRTVPPRSWDLRSAHPGPVTASACSSQIEAAV